MPKVQRLKQAAAEYSPYRSFDSFRSPGGPIAARDCLRRSQNNSCHRRFSNRENELKIALFDLAAAVAQRQQRSDTAQENATDESCVGNAAISLQQNQRSSSLSRSSAMGLVLARLDPVIGWS